MTPQVGPLTPGFREIALDLYRSADIAFPLIGAVLLGNQDGLVLADDPSQPSLIYVEHAFGFAQLFGELNSDAVSSVLDARQDAASREGRKIRLYAPEVPALLRSARFEPARRTRQRFRLPAIHTRPSTGARDGVRAAGPDDIDAIDRAFGVVRRFWRDKADFLNRSYPTLAVREGGVAAICYAAAEADGETEIDVATRPDLRRRGLARDAAAVFIERCRDGGVEPLWDCFTNNVGSMQLAYVLGFEPSGDPYDFYTLER